MVITATIYEGLNQMEIKSIWSKAKAIRDLTGVSLTKIHELLTCIFKKLAAITVKSYISNNFCTLL